MAGQLTATDHRGSAVRPRVEGDVAIDTTGHVAASPRPRDPFLDVVRAVAILRVLVWHLFGFAFISYLVAAMPAVFFVSGSLLAASSRRAGSSLRVVADRLRRLFIPLWVFTAVVWAVVEGASTGDSLEWGRAVRWLVPVLDPPALRGDLEFLSSPLWFVRALFWLLLLAPLLLRAARRHPGVLLSLLAASVFAADLAGRHPAWTPGGAPRLWWYVGDLCLYATFLVAGFVHDMGVFRRLRTRHWLVLAADIAVLAAWWRMTQPVPNGVVNDSQPLHLLVGAGWLALAFAAASPLASVTRWRPAGSVVAFLSRRSLTVYLWHTTVMVVVIDLLERRGSPRPLFNDIAYVVLTGAGIVVATVLFGWVEDLAAGRRPAAWPAVRHPHAPRRRPVAFATVFVVLAAAVLVEPWSPPSVVDTAAAGPPPVRIPRVPSQAPPPPLFTVEPPAAEEPAPVPVAALPATLEAIVDEWAAGNDMAGVVVGVRSPADGREWRYAVGSRPDTGAAMTVDDPIDLASMTKLFTTALVFRSADLGLVDIDAPLPPLDAVPEFPHDRITPRMLLAHRSGLVNYRETPEYKDDPASIDSPEAAVAASARRPLDFEPGTKGDYSSVNFLVLGLVLEQVWQRPFTEILETQILAPLGLRDTQHLQPAPGEPRGGGAGLISNVPDVMRATQALLRDTGVVSSWAHGVMRQVDPETGFGVGVMALCPCTKDPEPTYFSHGYFGRTTLTAYVPSLDLVVTADLPYSIHHVPRYGQVVELMESLTTLAASSWRQEAPAVG